MKRRAMRAALFAGDAFQAQAELDIGLRRLPRQQRILLEDHAAVGTRPRDLAAGNPDLTGGRSVKAGNDAQEGRLTAARGTDDRYELVRA